MANKKTKLIFNEKGTSVTIAFAGGGESLVDWGSKTEALKGLQKCLEKNLITKEESVELGKEILEKDTLPMEKSSERLGSSKELVELLTLLSLLPLIPIASGRSAINREKSEKPVFEMCPNATEETGPHGFFFNDNNEKIFKMPFMSKKTAKEFIDFLLKAEIITEEGEVSLLEMVNNSPLKD